MPPEDEEEEKIDDEWLEGEQWSDEQPEMIIDLGPGERKREPWEELGEVDLESQLLLRVVLPGREPPPEEYSQLSCSDFIGTIPPIGLRNLPPDFQPQKTLEQLCLIKEKDFVMVCKAGHGKTSDAIFHGLDQVYASDERYILSFTHSRAVGRTQQQKFDDLSGRLVEGSETCEAYFFGEDWRKQAIREGERDFSMLLITPQTYTGSYAYYAGELTEGHPAAVESYVSDEAVWLKTLESPQIILIDEVDSFPTSTLLWLVPLVRILKWRESFTEVILASATLANPDDIALRFLGPEGNYEVLSGTGRRGKLVVSVYLETKREQLLEWKIQEILTHIETELAILDENPKHNPKKVLLFINHKIIINIRTVLKQFSDHFVIVHGDMKYEEIANEIENFRTDPDKICLVATQLVEAGLDLPDIYWQVSYGLLLQPRQFMQLRDRTIRQPGEDGKMDIILRGTNKEEKEYADPDKKEDLKTYVEQQDPVPLRLPWYTPWSLRFWIAMGVLFRFPDVVERIQTDLNHFTETPSFQQHLKEAIIDLYVKRVIRLGEDGQLYPTPATKGYITGFLHKNVESIYTIIREEDEKELGKVDYLTILRHYLVGQSLPFKGYNYMVTEIRRIMKGKKEIREIRVERKPPELYWYWNRVESTLQRSKIYAISMEKEVALVQLSTTHEVTQDEIDDRTRKTKKSQVDPFIERHLGVFIGATSPWTMDAKMLLEKISHKLHIENTELKASSYSDSLLGQGTLIIDKSTVELALLIYDYLIKEDLWVQAPSESTRVPSESVSPKGLPQDRKPRFRHFKNFLAKYQHTVIFLADLHLDGNPFRVGGQEVDFRLFCQELFEELQHATLIVFLGDTVDITDTTDEDLLQALGQLHVLYEVLDEYQILEKTVFLLGNHDYNATYYRWYKRVRVEDSIALQLFRSMPRALISHGNNLGLEQLIKSGLSAKRILAWKKSLKDKIADCYAKEEDLVIVGHSHLGRLFKKEGLLMVPSMKKYWLNPPKDHGWLGLLGYENPYYPEASEFKIDA